LPPRCFLGLASLSCGANSHFKNGSLVMNLTDTLFGGRFSDDGTLYAFGCADNSARILRVSDAEPILKFTRNSPSNRHMLIYGIAADTQSAMQYSKFCINAIFRALKEHLLKVPND